MKRYITVVLLMIIIGNIGALDTDSYQFIDHLLSIRAPGAPEVYEDVIIFTASSRYRSVGIAFGHEGFSRVYWFEKLMAPQNTLPSTEPRRRFRRQEDPFLDSGILFHTIPIPGDVQEIEYRLIIDGLWTVDPLNPQQRLDMQSGLLLSLVELPPNQPIYRGYQGGTTFQYRAPPGETITLAGDFN